MGRSMRDEDLKEMVVFSWGRALLAEHVGAGVSMPFELWRLETTHPRCLRDVGCANSQEL